MRDNLSQRPKIDVPKTHWDCVADALGFLDALACAWLLLALSTDVLPSDAQPASGFERWSLALPLLTGIAVYVMLRLLARVPYYYNYPWPITRENVSIQYRLFRSMVFWLNTVIVWMLLLIAWSQTRESLSGSGWFEGGMVVGSIFLIHLVLGTFIYRGYQHRHGERSDERERTFSSQP